MKGVLLVGATGSIGCSTLDVMAALPDRLRLVGVFAGRNGGALSEIARRFDVLYAGLAGDAAPEDCGRARTGCGEEFLREAIAAPEVDIVLNAATGAAGLPASVAAAEFGKTIALANKESLVMAGPLLGGAEIVPVDSEHSAIHQCLRSGRIDEVHRVILTASGGPFRTWSAERIAAATPEDALNHPTWSMGPKVTIDSATLMNKALELIEARWLFGLEPDKLDAVVHPQSIVHSFVEFVDGSVIAQLGAPDMRVPIQYALCWPERHTTEFARFDLKDFAQLTFEEPDRERFGALDLAAEVLRRGGTAGAVFNAANEVAVERFLAGSIPFPAITETVAEVLARVETTPATDLETVQAADRTAREEATTCRI
ncbi:MAG: 1-deoxy-D-xylulose-5-phosphate reductoisomerase [Planctomycetota bacterium]|jgi:1-deoxy-D-xylulose-5-phosphate reductoisomerase